jgi:hypothetical protein
MSEKTQVITDAPKPPLRRRVKSKLSALKPDRTTTLIALTGAVSMVASYAGTRAEFYGFTRATNQSLRNIADQIESTRTTSIEED